MTGRGSTVRIRYNPQKKGKFFSLFCFATTLSKEREKLKKAGLTTTKSEFVDAPIINEFSIALECKLIENKDDLYRMEIINVSIDERVIVNDKVDLSLVKPIVFDTFNKKYLVLGNEVGNAFKDGLQ